ncbi:MAG: hypothetical protein A2901_05210 [Elusimicrobia bacterium RIFCSPLOWO2_01_FULL_54_10]|nr:MAG: hypothetical protein A2901_05210 [Elusimicrobia bacterium RIFCSPLOWO2_01_FULL_54_10]
MKNYLWIFILLIAAGCKSAKEAVDNAASEATGHRAAMQGKTTIDKAEEAMRQEAERVRKHNENAEKAGEASN